MISFVGVVAIMAFGGVVFTQFSANGIPALLILSGLETDKIESELLEHYKTAFDSDTYTKISEGQYSFTYTFSDINNDRQNDVIATIKSDATCGSGGCITSIVLINDDMTFETIPFEYAVHLLTPLQSITRGMRDLRINSNADNLLIWNGHQYILEPVAEKF
jgi:hypothetical protein